MMTDIALPSQESSTVHVVTLAGDIDMARILELDELLEEFRRGPASYVLVDLTAVEFMDSTGLGMMARLRREAIARGGTLSVVNPSAQVARTIRIAGLSAAFNLRSS